MRQAAAHHVVRDDKQLLLLEEVGDDGEQFGVDEPPSAKLLHVLREVLSPDATGDGLSSRVALYGVPKFLLSNTMPVSPGRTPTSRGRRLPTALLERTTWPAPGPRAALLARHLPPASPRPRDAAVKPSPSYRTGHKPDLGSEFPMQVG